MTSFMKLVFLSQNHAQYEPLGVDGDPFDGLEGKRGVMTLKGAPEMLVNALDRGSNCSKDFSTSRLQLAAMPLSQLRQEFNVTLTYGYGRFKFVLVGVFTLMKIVNCFGGGFLMAQASQLFLLSSPLTPAPGRGWLDGPRTAPLG